MTYSIKLYIYSVNMRFYEQNVKNRNSAIRDICLLQAKKFFSSLPVELQLLQSVTLGDREVQNRYPSEADRRARLKGQENPLQQKLASFFGKGRTLFGKRSASF